MFQEAYVDSEECANVEQRQRQRETGTHIALHHHKITHSTGNIITWYFNLKYLCFFEGRNTNTAVQK